MTAQIEAIAGDIRIDATKIGMLATAAIVEAVASAIEELDLPLVVLDPVMVSSSGERLLDEDGIQALRFELLPRARVVTPNIPEAEVLSGCRIVSPDDRRRAAERIHEMGAAAVVITGGHWSAIVERTMSSICCSMATSFTELKTPRVGTTAVIGCTGPAARLRRRWRPGSRWANRSAIAAGRAQRYVAGAIAHGIAIGHGARVLDHFWQTSVRLNDQIPRDQSMT